MLCGTVVLAITMAPRDSRTATSADCDVAGCEQSQVYVLIDHNIGLVLSDRGPVVSAGRTVHDKVRIGHVGARKSRSGVCLHQVNAQLVGYRHAWGDF
jgi:hypothetical protein